MSTSVELHTVGQGTVTEYSNTQDECSLHFLSFPFPPRDKAAVLSAVIEPHVPWDGMGRGAGPPGRYRNIRNYAKGKRAGTTC